MFKYGEILVKNFSYYWRRRTGSPDHGFGYRIDPVPGIGHSYWRFNCYYKHPRIRKAGRAKYYEEKMFERSGRSPKNLYDPWDDIPRGDIRNRKSWKNKRIRKQWMKNI